MSEQQHISETPQHYLSAGNFNRLSRLANNYAGFYNAAVFLTGSSLMREGYRDIDMVIVVTDDDFAMMYGPPEQFDSEHESWMFTHTSWSYYKDRMKRVRDTHRRIGLYVDVKIQCLSKFKGFECMPKLRLDTSPFFPELKSHFLNQPKPEEDVKQQNGDSSHQ